MRWMMLIVVFASLLSLASACAGLFGGGGGCCCGGGGCGGGGRKKRSVAEPEFYGVSSRNEDMLCNSPELRQLIVKNMRGSAADSTKSLQVALEEDHMERYVVVCSQAPFQYSVRADTAYCGARNGSHYCQAFAV